LLLLDSLFHHLLEVDLLPIRLSRNELRRCLIVFPWIKIHIFVTHFKDSVCSTIKPLVVCLPLLFNIAPKDWFLTFGNKFHLKMAGHRLFFLSFRNFTLFNFSWWRLNWKRLYRLTLCKIRWVES